MLFEIDRFECVDYLEIRISWLLCKSFQTRKASPHSVHANYDRSRLPKRAFGTCILEYILASLPLENIIWYPNPELDGISRSGRRAEA